MKSSVANLLLLGSTVFILLAVTIIIIIPTFVSSKQLPVVTWDVVRQHDLGICQSPQVCVRSLSVFPRNCIKNGFVPGNFFFYCNEGAGTVDLYRCASNDFYCNQPGCAFVRSFVPNQPQGSTVFGNIILNFTGFWYDMGSDGFWVQTKYWPLCKDATRNSSCSQTRCGTDAAGLVEAIPATNNVCYGNVDGGNTWSCRSGGALVMKTVWVDAYCAGGASYGWSGNNGTCWGTTSGYPDRWWACYPSNNNFYAIIFGRIGSAGFVSTKLEVLLMLILLLLFLL